MGDSWFDARENLTGVDPSGTQGSQVDPEQGAPEGTPGWFWGGGYQLAKSTFPLCVAWRN